MAVAGKWTRIEDVFPIKDGDIPASYVIVYQRVIYGYIRSPKSHIQRPLSFSTAPRDILRKVYERVEQGGITKVGEVYLCHSSMSAKMVVRSVGPGKPVVNGVKWGPYKWPYKWASGFITPLSRVITLLMEL